MKTIKTLIAPVAVLCLGAGVAWADSISPTSFAATIDVGESVTVLKTVTVSAGRPTSSKVDVYFLADSTGSMFGEIGAVQASASSILSSTAGLGDVAFAVGEYKDVGDVFVYRLNSGLSTVQANAQAGINLWSASGGGDTPEAQMFALEQLANTTPWRAGSERILVWFGDAPGHDPRNGSTEASATAALVANRVQTQAINVGGMNSTGQAVRIANATGGAYYAGISSGSIVDTIKDAITAAFDTYSTVSLDLSEVPAGLTASVAPGSYVGAFDRSVERTFGFALTFTGVAPGDYSFPIYGTVDGGRVAKEDDRITVREKGTGIPDGGSSMLLLGLAAIGLGLARRRN